MATLEVIKSIHTPGLDLTPTRMSDHTMLMDAVHQDQRLIAACAWAFYEREGRGALYVDRDAWIEIIKNQAEPEGGDFPCVYVRRGGALPDPNKDLLEPGFSHLVEHYDPETSFLLVVQHRQGRFLSCYHVQPVYAPRDAGDINR